MSGRAVERFEVQERARPLFEPGSEDASPSSQVDDYLQPFISLPDHFRKVVTVGRVLTFAVVVLICVGGWSSLPPEKFAVSTTLENVHSFSGCLHYCQRSMSDPVFANSLNPPGTGLCASEDGTAMVKYEVCQRESRKKMNCTTVTSDESFPADYLRLNQLYSTRCTFKLAPSNWKPYATLIILVMCMMLILQGGPPQLLLLGGACVLCAIGIILPEDVFAGLSNEGVVGLAVLFPIADAIAETGMLEKGVGMMLGTPSSLREGIPRMMFPTAILSAFLSNTATVAMLIPIIESWARRLGVHPGKILMPLSFAAQLGGCWTLVGSSHILVAKAVIPSSTYDLGFFDLLPLGLIITATTTVVITFLAPTGALTPSLAQSEQESSDVTGDAYQVVFVVNNILAHTRMEDSGLERLSGVYSVQRSPDAGPELEAGEELMVQCSETGVIALRAHPGLSLRNQADLSMLGARRRERHLYEITIHSNFNTSSFPGVTQFRQQFGACFVAGPKRASGSFGASAMAIVPGSVVLVEAHDAFPQGRAAGKWSEAFALVRQIPDSSPLRLGLPSDGWRNAATCIGMLVLITCVTLDMCSLAFGGGILLLFYLFIRALSPAALQASINGRILLIIAGAIGMSVGLKKSGLVDFMGGVLVAINPFGPPGVTAMIYITIWIFGLFLNNSAIVAIVGPMIVGLCNDQPDLSKRGLVFTLIYVAGSSFTSPLGYQTNLMVMPVGKYTFLDFVRFGVLVQFSHFVQIMLLITFVEPLLP